MTAKPGSDSESGEKLCILTCILLWIIKNTLGVLQFLTRNLFGIGFANQGAGSSRKI